jgi:hypothetical protein
VDQAEELWRAYRRLQRRSRRALRWTLLIAVGRRLIYWDLLREPRLEREIPAGSSGLSFFVPVRRGGVPLGAQGKIRGLPLQTRLLPSVDDADGLPVGFRLSVTLKNGPLITLSVREITGSQWRLRAKFRERSGGRAARLGFRRLAPEGSAFRRLGRLTATSISLLANALRPGGAFRIAGKPAAARVPDFYLAEVSPRQLSSQGFWPTIATGGLLCPLAAGLVAAVLLHGLGGSTAALAFCLLSAAGVAWTGGLVCGSTVSVFASTIGAIPLTAALAVLNGMAFKEDGGAAGLLAHLTRNPLRVAVLGGFPTLVPAPAWRVALVDIGLILLSFAMAAARRGMEIKRAEKNRLAGIVAIVTACVGPGLVAGLSYLLEGSLSRSWPLPVSLGLIGGPAFATCLALQSAARRRAVLAGGVYAAVCFLLPLALSGLQGTLAALLLTLVGAHVLLQGTFFALSYLLGERLGGVWAGAAVSSFQGAVGYTLFLISRGAIAWP